MVWRNVVALLVLALLSAAFVMTGEGTRLEIALTSVFAFLIVLLSATLVSANARSGADPGARSSSLARDALRSAPWLLAIFTLAGFALDRLGGGPDDRAALAGLAFSNLPESFRVVATLDRLRAVEDAALDFLRFALIPVVALSIALAASAHGRFIPPRFTDTTKNLRSPRSWIVWFVFLAAGLWIPARIIHFAPAFGRWGGFWIETISLVARFSVALALFTLVLTLTLRSLGRRITELNSA